ncbi:MAG: hypothetical protein HYU76_00145 [Betaproteobacteria bacterium]|nr:hypothetical protein [Betaproteobacteria bacterium]
MNLQRFRQSLKSERPPRGLGAPLRALWHEARGDWDGAHGIVQREGGKAAARVHAYLHRKEGDSENADYWYARAGEERPSGTLDKEWESLVQSFLDETLTAKTRRREGNAK